MYEQRCTDRKTRNARSRLDWSGTNEPHGQEDQLRIFVESCTKRSSNLYVGFSLHRRKYLLRFSLLPQSLRRSDIQEIGEPSMYPENDAFGDHHMPRYTTAAGCSTSSTRVPCRVAFCISSLLRFPGFCCPDLSPSFGLHVHFNSTSNSSLSPADEGPCAPGAVVTSSEPSDKVLWKMPS